MVDLRGPSTFRVLGIDPGTDTMGLACLTVDLDCHTVALEAVMTLQGHRNARYTPMITEVHGERIGRLHAHRQALIRQFAYFQPHAVICEAPFMGRFPAAYGALVECVAYIRFALYDYHPLLPLEMVDPPTAKMAVGVSGKSKDKLEIMEAVHQLVQGPLQNPHGIEIRALDEHSTDAIAVAYTRALGVVAHLKEHDEQGIVSTTGPLEGVFHGRPRRSKRSRRRRR